MKRLSICLFGALIWSAQTLQAQKLTEITSNWAQNIQVDGQLHEWGDSLDYYFADQDLWYSIANDGERLYFAVRVKNKSRQAQAVLNGISVILNPQGKKREGPELIFPIPDRSALSALRHELSENSKADFRKTAMQAVRALFVQKFPDIVDGAISLENSYGLRAAVSIDEDDNLCYESSIALARLPLKNLVPIAVNLKINGIITTRYTSGPMGTPYGMRNYYYDNRRPRTTISKRQEPGVWHTLLLASDPNQP